MATYRKGEDQSGLQQAANDQKSMRMKEQSSTQRFAAGRMGGPDEIYLSNLSVGQGKTAPTGALTRINHRSKNKDIIPVKRDVPISGTAVAERSEKLKKTGNLSPVKKIGNQKAGPYGTAGVIKAGALREDKKTTAPKKKAASAKDVRTALKSGNVSIEEAEGLNKKGLSSPIKKKK